MASNKINFDIRSLVAAPDQSGNYGKVNFEVSALETYKENFLKEVRGSEGLALTGAGPAWLYMSLWHEAHGTIPDGAIKFVAPGVEYVPVAPGSATGDSSKIVDGKIIVDITGLEPKGADGRTNFVFGKVGEYQKMVLAMVPAFKVGEPLPEFEVVLTGAGPVWLFLALTAALHSRGGPVIYSAPNAPRVVIIDHK